VAEASGDAAVSGAGNCPIIYRGDGREPTMTRDELLQQILRGRLVLVGEFRGAHAESSGYVDQRTGEAISYVRAIYLVECACRGVLDCAIIRQRRLGIENPEQVSFPYEKGKLYAFFLEGFKMERGHFSGWIGDRGPELIETGEEALGAPVGAPAPLNLVSLQTTPQSV
jgi:hypothetical protein